MLVPVSSRLHGLRVSTCFQLPNWHDVILSSNFITKLQILTQKMKLRMTKMSVWKMETSIYRPTCRDHWPRHEDRTTFICYFCEYFCRLVSFTFCEVQMLINVFYRHSGRGAGDTASSSRQQTKKMNHYLLSQEYCEHRPRSVNNTIEYSEHFHVFRIWATWTWWEERAVPWHAAQTLYVYI